MKFIRFFSILIFIGSVVLFGKYKENVMMYEDTTSPLITMDSEVLTINCSASRSALLKGVTAHDQLDGDVSDTLIVESMSNFIEKGRRTYTIAAFDSSNNITKVTREVIYRDYTSPKFYLEEPCSYPLDSKNIIHSIEAMDKLDGDITNRIKMSTEYYVQVDEPGIYPMVFTVANSAGDVSKLPVNIEIYDPLIKSRQPEIILTDYLIYIDQGEKINPWDYVEKIYARNREYIRNKEDNILHDEDLEKQFEREIEKLSEQEKINKLETKEDYIFAITVEDLQIENNVNVERPGAYEIVYRYDAFIEAEDNRSAEEIEESTGSVRLIVVVNE